FGLVRAVASSVSPRHSASLPSFGAPPARSSPAGPHQETLMAKPIRRFVPRLETFDERVLPSVTTNYTATDGVLVVKGDAANDVIAITDTGKGDAGAVTVFEHGVSVFTSTELVSQILVFTY